MKISIKFILERWRSNVGIGQFLLTSYIAIKVGDFPVWLFVLFVLSSIIYTIYYDIKFIFPRESATTYRLNPEFMEMKQMVKEIRNNIVPQTTPECDHNKPMFDNEIISPGILDRCGKCGKLYSEEPSTQENDKGANHE